MSDTALQDPALPTYDAPPSSAGRSSPHGVEQTQAPEPISDELKARLDKVIYSDVSIYWQYELKLGCKRHQNRTRHTNDCVACRSASLHF
jgi:hypothetical protein